MNVALWVVQGLLAVVFLMVSAMKVMQPKEKIVGMMVGAAMTNLRRKENQKIVRNRVLLALAGGIAIGRF